MYLNQFFCTFFLLAVFNANALLHDPTRPPSREETNVTLETEKLKLFLIKIDEKGNYTANINGIFVEKGDLYADGRIDYIDNFKVILVGPMGRKLELKLINEESKYPIHENIGEIVYPDIKKPDNQ